MKAASTNVRAVVALFDCDAEADGELSFKAGDVIDVIDDSDDGWWTGAKRTDEGREGRVGVFPSNYVKPQDVRAPTKSVRLARVEADATRAPPTNESRVVVAIYDCDDVDDGELAFKAGDLIDVVDTSDSGWWTGKLPDGRQGLFPENYAKAAAAAS